MGKLSGESNEIVSLGARALLVERVRLVRKTLEQARRAGVVFICAPAGFGKTALLMQCVAAIQSNPEEGPARIMDVRGMEPGDLLALLDDLAQEIDPAHGALIALDNLPAVGSAQVEKVVERLRALRDAKAKVLVACTPCCRPVVRAMGDSEKVNASSLLVRPNEYAKWVDALGISNALDVYGLTEGIPSLVVSLSAAAGDEGGGSALEREVVEVYRSAIDELRAQRDPLLRLVCLMVMVGRGTIGELERSGLRIKEEVLVRLKRDYPIISFDAQKRSYRCLGSDAGGLSVLREEIARRRRPLAVRAARMLLGEWRVDEAVDRMKRYLEPADCEPLLSQYPMRFVLHGHAAYVREMAEKVDMGCAAGMGAGAVLALWASALCMGDYRAARMASAELRRHADGIKEDVSADEWAMACAFQGLWANCKGIDLPNLPEMRVPKHPSREAEALIGHVDRMKDVAADIMRAKVPRVADAGVADQVVLTHILAGLDACLIFALQTSDASVGSADEWLSRTIKNLMGAKLVPLAARARMVLSACRLMTGRPVVDDLAFTDASRIAVREVNHIDQMLCLVLEGWQYMALGQAVNAEFRAQQVQKLSEEGHESLAKWSVLLERVAAISNSSRLVLRQEAELYDLANEVASAEEAWAVALHLSAARYDADLAAWYSLHRSLMLEPNARGRARLALHLMGGQADSIRRLLPRRLCSEYELKTGTGLLEDAERDEEYEEMMREVGQVRINLFGGFHAMRNGHILTEDIWKRRKAAFLAARLALAKGTFISKRVVMDELWPEASYQRARQNLYVTMTALRQALHQTDDGPQYIVTQASAIALNEEYVSTDLARFDMLARDVLLKRTGISSRQIVETCLRLEEVYKGQLYVPDVGDVAYFSRMRQSYASKFVDCMVRGVDAALEEEDVPSASWLAEAAIKQAPTREDVVRRMMKVMGIEGRRREVVELYTSHLYYLQHELGAEPEQETVALYNKIVDGARSRTLL